MLTQKQKDTYAKDGYVILSNIISKKNLQGMQVDLNKWIEESKSHSNNYGKTKNGNLSVAIFIHPKQRGIGTS